MLPQRKFSLMPDLSWRDLELFERTSHFIFRSGMSTGDTSFTLEPEHVLIYICFYTNSALLQLYSFGVLHIYFLSVFVLIIGAVSSNEILEKKII